MYEFAVAPAVTSIRRRGVVITAVTPDTLGGELELEPGDRVIKVNGRPVRDYLDFRFQTGGETELTLEVRKKTGEDWELEIERDEGEDFGLSFEQIVPRQCANECIFCFCKGNPEDARPSLFIRDEDIRLSFLYGNYTTLTSITEDEMQRIIEQRLSPQYVSIHAMDLEVRAYLLGIDKSRAGISDKLARLMDNGIEIHAQVVLCPTINDGEVLRQTIFDLAAHYPRVSSVAIVPLGLTRYNTDERLTAVTPEFCRETIKQVTAIQGELRTQVGTTFAFLGDEIYLRGGSKVPSRRHYGDYPQIEDGIGMVRSFANEFTAFLKRLDRRPPKDTGSVNGTIMTGKLFAPVLEEKIAKLNERFGTRLDVAGIENHYFGGDVSVAGLLTGSDFTKAADKLRGDFLVIPRSTLKSDEDIMLDGMTLAELQRNVGVPVYPLDMRAFGEWLG
ncbi:MAG: Fe-S oxidoreductase, NifB/MoaA family [Acidobacteria bacterium]|nr:Fe-S oxidoreductase, NifB/MoaA family [Acidobacteriota bacterium]